MDFSRSELEEIKGFPCEFFMQKMVRKRLGDRTAEKEENPGVSVQ